MFFSIMLQCQIQTYFLSICVLMNPSNHIIIIYNNTDIWHWLILTFCFSRANKCVPGLFSRVLGAGLIPDIYRRQADSSLVWMKGGLDSSGLIRFINSQLQGAMFTCTQYGIDVSYWESGDRLIVPLKVILLSWMIWFSRLWSDVWQYMSISKKKTSSACFGG